jgi:CheY-like chemotaxis protein
LQIRGLFSTVATLMAAERKRVLFVDDDESFLKVLREILAHWTGESWDVLTASDVARALAILHQESADLVVVDARMPVMDGPQLVGLLRRAYPQVARVVLTDQADEADRAACLSAGAQLYLEKPVTEAGWHNLFTALSEVLRLAPTEGFRGVLRAMNLQDILQMECLAQNSSVLEVKAPGCTGQVFIQTGQIVHAEAGDKRGMEALELLLGLKGGEFSLHPFTQPLERTLTDRWEFVLMEAARRRDEAQEAALGAGPDQSVTIQPPHQPEVATAPDQTHQAPASIPTPASPQACPPIELPQAQAPTWPTAEPEGQPILDEVLLASPQGDVLFEWHCTQLNDRLRFLEFLSERAHQLAQYLALGHLDRWDAEAGPVRVLCQIRAERTVWVRRTLRLTEPRGEAGAQCSAGPSEASWATATGWLAAVSPVGGLLVVGVHRPDRPGPWRSCSEAWPAEKIEPVWRLVSDTFQVLRANHLPAQRVCWVYERATLLSYRRHDGLWLAMLIDQAAPTTDWDGLQRLATEFSELT